MSENNQNIFVIKVDMENRSAEDIARDAAKQVGELFDRLVEERKKGDTQKE